jgi:hypothetical protein
MRSFYLWLLSVRSIASSRIPRLVILIPWSFLASNKGGQTVAWEYLFRIRLKEDDFTAGSPAAVADPKVLMLLPFLSWLQFVSWYFKNSSFAVLRPLKMCCCHQSKGKKRHRAVPLHSPIARRLLHSRESSCISFLFYGSMYTFSFFLASRLPHCGSRDSLALVESICAPKAKNKEGRLLIIKSQRLLFGDRCRMEFQAFLNAR